MSKRIPRDGLKSMYALERFGNEADFRSSLLKELKKIPRTKWWKNNTGRRGRVSFGAKGSPDIMGILPNGRHAEIETKMPGERTTEDQDKWHRESIELGAFCIVVDNMADAIRLVMEASVLCAASNKKIDIRLNKHLDLYFDCVRVSV